MNVAVGSSSDIGKVRKGNEDAYLARAPMFAVADGMGGHLAGEVASETAIQVLSEGTGEGEPLVANLEELLREANRAVWEKAQSDAQLRGMGTTCSVVVVVDNRAHIAHVGDSRVYLFRKGDLSQVTEDHTLVARMVREGRLRPEDAEHHPQRSVITRALGVDEDVEVDRLDIELSAGDRLLICSDGLSSMLSHDEIRGSLATSPDPQMTADALVAAANEAGGDDNVTVVVIDVGGEAVAVPERVSTDSGPVEQPTGRRGLKGLVALLVVAALGAGLYAGYVYAMSNVLWYVGTDDAGVVTIYHGLPEEVAGIRFSREAEKSDLEIDELPEFARADVIEGHKVDSLAEAEAYIANLEARAADFSGAPSPSPTGTGK